MCNTEFDQDQWNFSFHIIGKIDLPYVVFSASPQNEVPLMPHTSFVLRLTDAVVVMLVCAG